MPDYFDLATPIALCDHGRCGERVALRTCLRTTRPIRRQSWPSAATGAATSPPRTVPQKPALATD